MNSVSLILLSRHISVPCQSSSACALLILNAPHTLGKAAALHPVYTVSQKGYKGTEALWLAREGREALIAWNNCECLFLVGKVQIMVCNSCDRTFILSAVPSRGGGQRVSAGWGVREWKSTATWALVHHGFR